MLIIIERNSTSLIETAPPNGLTLDCVTWLACMTPRCKNNGRGAKETKGYVERRKRCSAKGLHNSIKDLLEALRQWQVLLF